MWKRFPVSQTKIKLSVYSSPMTLPVFPLALYYYYSVRFLQVESTKSRKNGGIKITGFLHYYLQFCKKFKACWLLKSHNSDTLIINEQTIQIFTIFDYHFLTKIQSSFHYQ